jgi:hypothetical protein
MIFFAQDVVKRAGGSFFVPTLRAASPELFHTFLSSTSLTPRRISAAHPLSTYSVENAPSQNQLLFSLVDKNF